MKATHKGTCQICGRQHKVNTNTGMLAKHGYTIDFGWFNGTCTGSDNLPYEKSCDMTKKSISLTNDYINTLKNKIESIKLWQVNDEIDIVLYFGFNEYFKGSKSGYYNIKCKIVDNIEAYGKTGNLGYEYVIDGKTIQRYERNPYGTKQNLMNHLIERNIKLIEKDIKACIEYINMQQHKVDTWKLVHLIEIK